MFKKALLALGLITWMAASLPMAEAQNTTCSDRPAGDSSNACANTRFVMTNGGGGGGGGPCTLFTASTSGCVVASGGIPDQFLRSDNTFAYTDAIPVGAVIPWSGATVPDKYLLAMGQQVARASYPDLFTATTYSGVIACTSGSPTITVPDSIVQRSRIGAPIEAPGCFPTVTFVVSKGASTLTFNNNATASASVTARIFPWGNGDGSTTFNLPNLVGRVPVGRDNMSGTPAGILTSTYWGNNPDALNSVGGAQSTTLLTANLPPYTPSGSLSGSLTVNDPGHAHATDALKNNATSSTGGGAFPIPNPAAGSVSLAFTGITVTGTGMTLTGAAQGGTSTPFSTIQPAITIDYIVKVLPGGAGGGGGGGGSILWATLLDMYAGTAIEKAVAPAIIWPPEVVVTYGTTTTFDMSTFRDAVVTLTGNITTMTLTNPTVGKSGSITFIQDGTGSRTTVWDSKFKFAGGTAPVLSTTANAVDILSYQCRTSTFCFGAMMKDVK